MENRFSENKNWPDEVRLKMIKESEFYPDDKQVYQYGFYDGFQYAKAYHEAKLKEELIKFSNWVVNPENRVNNMDTGREVVNLYLKTRTNG